MISWNPWHGCVKYSEGCMNCYVYRMDKQYGRDPSKMFITQSFYLPISKTRTGEYKYPSGTKFFTCYTSDFFLDQADYIRNEAWKIMKERSDCFFMIITKRIDRVQYCLPSDWNDGYDNVEIVCTIENQKQADIRLPIYYQLPIKHKSLCVEPLITGVHIELYLYGMGLNKIIAGGESGYGESIRPCKEEWVQRLYNVSHKYNIPFCFKQTGTYFVHLNGELETIARQNQFKRATELGYQDFLIDSL